MVVVSLATTVTAGVDAEIRQGLAGETIVAGEVVYLNAAGRYMKALANGTAIQAEVVGIAINGAGDGQPLQVVVKGTVNGLTGLKPGSIYALANVAGDVADVYSTDLTEDTSYVSVVGVATTATAMKVGVVNSGVKLNRV